MSCIGHDPTEDRAAVAQLPAPSRPGDRAADADREQVVERLRQAHVEGRLTLDEFDDRARAVWATRTYGELADATADLPRQQPGEELRNAPDDHRARRAAVPAWLVASVLNVVIWAAVSIAAGAAVYPWFVWVVGPWGAVLLVRRLAEVRAAGRPAGG